MEETLTGAPAEAYVSAWMESARSGRPLNAARLRRDALEAARSSRALSRLRLASARIGVRVASSLPVRATVREQRPRVKARRTLRTSPGAPDRPRGEA